ncbi:MAG TPA: hypothetical protein VF796_26175, partial [Humisphaera sp.]
MVAVAQKPNTKSKSNGSPQPQKKPAAGYDPDQYRMTLGDHLEELRTRMFLGLAGYVVALIACFVFGEKIVWYFCHPLIYALEKNKLPPTVY